MNDKESILYKIVEVVVDCCSTKFRDGRMSVTVDDVLGPSRKENVTLTREIVVGQIYAFDYTITTISELLNRSPHQVSAMLSAYYENVKRSRAFRFADAQATIACDKIRPQDCN